MAIYARTRAAYSGLGPTGSPGRTRERTPPHRAEQPLFPARARNIDWPSLHGPRRLYRCAVPVSRGRGVIATLQVLIDVRIWCVEPTDRCGALYTPHHRTRTNTVQCFSCYGTVRSTCLRLYPNKLKSR